jgi:deazaflavin-dependent oxidoreductase (nitroreductase family)
MHKPLKDRELPKGIFRLLMRAPIVLYETGLGFILGGRFLMLTHIGRSSGRPKRVVLEVIKSDPESGIYYIGSGWGEKANWLLNIEKTPEVRVQTGNKVFDALASRLSANQASDILLNYGGRNPKAFRMLAGRFIVGQDLDISEESAELLAQYIPIVALKPVR